MNTTLKRVLASTAVVAAATATLPLLAASPASAATNSGSLATSPSQGTSDDNFTLSFAAGTTNMVCAKDTVNNGYTLQGFVVPASTDLNTLSFPAGPSVGQPLYLPSGTPLTDIPLDPANGDGTAGFSTQIPGSFTFGINSPGDFTDGAYTVGIACADGSRNIDNYWTTTFTLTNNPSGTDAAKLNWVQGVPAAAPSAPQNVVATPGDGSISVAFTAPATGSPTNYSYTATATPVGGGTAVTQTGTTSPINITGLSNGTAYNVTVTATNSAGTGPAGTAEPVTPVVGQSAQPVVTVTPGPQALTASIATPAGGSPASYDFTISGGPSDQTSFPASAGPVTFTGLTAGTTYTITVHTNYTNGNTTADVISTGIPNGSNVVVQNISGTRPSTGALVLTQNCGADPTCTVDLGTGASIQGGAYFEATGNLYPVTVTDTRDGDRGWTVKGQLTDFSKTVGTETFSGQALGWTPQVTGNVPVALPGYGGITATAGAATTPWAGTTLTSGSAVLMSAPAGHGLGSTTATAGLKLWIPVTASAGTYNAVLTMTAT